MAKETCKNGHDLTNHANFYRERDGGKRCRECKRLDYAGRAANQWAKKRQRGDTAHEVQKGPVHQRMLELIPLRERCATWWEREAIDREFAELQRKLGTVEA